MNFDPLSVRVPQPLSSPENAAPSDAGTVALDENWNTGEMGDDAIVELDVHSDESAALNDTALVELEEQHSDADDDAATSRTRTTSGVQREREWRQFAINIAAGIVTGTATGVMANLAQGHDAYAVPALPASVAAFTGSVLVHRAVQVLRERGYLPPC